MNNQPAATASLMDRLTQGMLCPDCGAGDMQRNEAARSSGWMNGALTCLSCGRDVAIADRLFHALPKELEEGEAANRDYYDAMSSDDASLLVRRFTTRNTRRKYALVREALQFDRARGPQLTLELGAGFGGFGMRISGEGHLWAGLDISPGLLRQAVSHHPELVWSPRIAADATRIPFSTGFFDAVFCVATLHHLPEPRDGVAEAIRVLRPGGRFCFVEPRRLYPTQILQALRHPETEVSAWHMLASRVAAWAREAGADRVEIARTVFTPNRPAFFEPVYRRIDRLCQDQPVLQWLAVMFGVYGSKSFGGGASE